MPLDRLSISTSISAPATPAPNPPSLAPAFGSLAVNLPPSIPPAPVSIPEPSTLAPPTSITRRHSAMPLFASTSVSFLCFYLDI